MTYYFQWIVAVFRPASPLRAHCGAERSAMHSLQGAVDCAIL